LYFPLVVIVACQLFALPIFAQADVIYRNPKASAEERVHDLLSRMTLEEKVAQLRSMWVTKQAILDENGDFSAARTLKAIPNGIGQLARPSDTMGSSRYRTDPYRSVVGTVSFR
jgi:beta-glucosidase